MADRPVDRDGKPITVMICFEFDDRRSDVARS